MRNYEIATSLALLAMTFNMAFAGEVLIKASPMSEFKTTGKNVNEGDKVEFKTDNGIITGVITHYEPNGFFGKNAEVTIGNFKTQDGKDLKGEIYLTGGEHKVLQECMESENTVSSLLGGCGAVIRGSEVVLTPNSVIEFFAEEE